MKRAKVAYFSMEVGLIPSIPTYSGGLGILAGDTLRSAADMGLPIIGVTLLHTRGDFKQRLDENGIQTEAPEYWNPNFGLRLADQESKIEIQGREVETGAWRYDITGAHGHTVPLYYVHTDKHSNPPWDEDITSSLYGGDHEYHRIAQEAVLGVGGVRLLEVLGYTPDIETYHMNEGHSAFLIFELLKQLDWDYDEAKKRCIFTTHTPVGAGHDEFTYDTINDVFREAVPWKIHDLAGRDKLSMTRFALNMSRYVNAVSKRHREVCEQMFPGYRFDSITNGVHLPTWTPREFQELYDHYFTNWRSFPEQLANSQILPTDEVWRAHQEAKRRLLEYIADKNGVVLDEDVLTIGYARRATPYKRMGLIFYDLDSLVRLSEKAGKIQMVFAGKSHPRDQPGKDIIRRVFERKRELEGRIKVVYLEDYNMETGGLMTGGCDLWLNTPKRKNESSQTSGMKAASSGVPQASIIDGWWYEAYQSNPEGGWSIGPGPGEEGFEDTSEAADAADAEDLYLKLENEIIPMYYHNRDAWIGRMKAAIRNAAYFNTHRVVREYAERAWGIELGKLGSQPKVFSLVDSAH